MATQTIDETKVEAFLEQILSEAGAALNAALIRIGDELGLYRAMGDAQPLTPRRSPGGQAPTSATCASG